MRVTCTIKIVVLNGLLELKARVHRLQITRKNKKNKSCLNAHQFLQSPCCFSSYKQMAAGVL